tara:strand:- start:20699 stop:21376 length:678 start_codon:yes stop_codon:yes gene_type:complete
MDSEDVNSISDSVEAQQVASIVRDTYFNIIATRKIPEHQELLKMTAASDSEFPTHFYYPENVKEITALWYEDKNGDYKEIVWCEPMDFLSRTDTIQEDYDTVLDKNGGTKLRILNDQDPRFYTSFDDYWVVLNSYDSTTEATLQESKVRAYGTKYPTFQISDGFTPDLDATLYPYFLAEAKSTAMSLLKGGSDPKVEQAARRQKAFMQNDMYRTKRPNHWSNYGR